MPKRAREKKIRLKLGSFFKGDIQRFQEGGKGECHKKKRPNLQQQALKKWARGEVPGVRGEL